MNKQTESELYNLIGRQAKLIEALEKRLGVECAAVHDPETGKTAEALTELAEANAIAKPPGSYVEEASLGLPSGAFAVIEEHLMRPGGLIQKMQTAQRETEERFDSINTDIENIQSKLDQLG